MEALHLPRLRGSVLRAEAHCNRCGRDSFRTGLGVGRLYWDGAHDGDADHVSLDRVDSVARIQGTVTCVGCGLEHAPHVALDAAR